MIIMMIKMGMKQKHKKYLFYLTDTSIANPFFTERKRESGVQKCLLTTIGTKTMFRRSEFSKVKH